MDDPNSELTNEEMDVINSIETDLDVKVDGVSLNDRVNEAYDDLRDQVATTTSPEYMLTDTRVVGYSSKEEQTLLFEMLAQIGIDPTLESVLDVGSGVGDFYGYLEGRLGTPIEYLGIDINPNMVNTAYQKYPNIKCIKKDLADMDGRFDFVISSGLFNLKLVDPMYDYLYKSIDKMYELSNIGTAFNMLSDNTTERIDGLFYYTPTTVFDYCLKKYNKVILKHDYLSDDFTIFIYK